MATHSRWIACNLLAFARQVLVRSTLVLAGLLVAMPGRLQADPVLLDDFGDNLINPSVWTVVRQGSGPAATEAHQRLEIVLPANSANDTHAAIFLAGYRSVCRLSGNFDLQVDYQLPTWPAGSGARMGLQAVDTGGVGRYMPGSGDGFPNSYATHFVLGCCGFVPTTDLSGKLRLVRSGGTMTGFFFNTNGTWRQVGSAPVTTEDVRFQLVAWSNDALFTDKEVRVAFDNFAINQGQLTCLANAGPDQTVDEGATVTLGGSNSSGVNAMFEWQQLAGPSVTLNTPTSAQASFTAPLLDGGFGSQVLTFRLTVTSGTESSSDTVDVTVRNVNRPPAAAAGADQFVNEGSPVSLDGSASFEPDSDPISFSWIQTGVPTVELTGADTANPGFIAPLLPRGSGAAEVLAFELTVSDGALSASDTVLVVVEQVNHAPVANAGADQTRNEGAAVTLDGTGSSDPDGDPIAYQWTQTSGPWVTLSDAFGAMPSFAAPPVTGAGGATLVFDLSVSDGFLSSTDQVVVNVVNVNDPPLCGAAQPSLARLWPPNHKMVQVGITGVADPNNDQLQITITGVTQDEPVAGLDGNDTSPDAVIQGSKVLLRAERSGDGNGRVYQIHFNAMDGQPSGGSCTGSVTVIVPHSEKRGGLALDDGQRYDSTSSPPPGSR